VYLKLVMCVDRVTPGETVPAQVDPKPDQSPDRTARAYFSRRTAARHHSKHAAKKFSTGNLKSATSDLGAPSEWQAPCGSNGCSAAPPDLFAASAVYQFGEEIAGEHEAR
jgi:hypothetical protein